MRKRPPEWHEHHKLWLARTPHVYVERDPSAFGLWTVYIYDGTDTGVQFAWTRRGAVAKGRRLIRGSGRYGAPEAFVVEIPKAVS